MNGEHILWKYSNFVLMSVTKEVFYGFAYQLLSLKIKLHAEKNMLELLVWDLPHFFNTNYIATVDCIKKQPMKLELNVVWIPQMSLKAINQLRTGKNSDIDVMVLEMWKNDGSTLYSFIIRLLGAGQTLSKTKGDKSECTNYHGIT